MPDARPDERYTHYNPVRVSDTVGALALALIALLLLAALLRAQAHNRALSERLARS